jgi:hypothetical protein
MPDEGTPAGSDDRGSDDNYYTYYLYTENDDYTKYDFVGFSFLYKGN